MADPLTPEQRSRCMAAVKSKDTKPERLVRSALHRRGLRFRKHVKALPGKPDIVFPTVKVAVFIDGDFWHGYRFRTWVHKISPFWQEKIASNRARDARNFRELRRTGWRVVRIWQHEIKADLDACVGRVARAVSDRRKAEVNLQADRRCGSPTEREGEA